MTQTDLAAATPDLPSAEATTAQTAQPTPSTPQLALPDAPERTEANTAVEGSFWGDLRDAAPPWLAEFVGLALLLFALLSFLALINTEQAVVALTWRNMLTSLFGYGSILVVAGIFVVGVSVFLPRLNENLRLAPNKTFALEVAFLCLLALLHLNTPDGELRALAREGQGGGILGWGLTVLPYWLLGQRTSQVLFALILLLCVFVLLGLRRTHIIHALLRTGERLQAWSAKLHPEAPKTEVVAPAANTPPIPPALLARRTPIMRIRPRRDQLPPSLRPTSVQLQQPNKNDEDLTKHPLFSAGRDLKLDVNIIGELTNRKTEDGHRIVRRPDGREKRYFAIEQMKEQKRVVKRDKILPPLDILTDTESAPPDEQEINRNVVLVENTLLEFDIDIDVVDVQIGPTVTRYAVQPYQIKKDGTTERVRLSRIASYASDLSLALSAKRLRLEIPVPGTNYMGIEVPNKQPSIVTLRSVYESKAFYELAQKSSSPLLVPLGRDVGGKPLAIDIAQLPHLLIAGTTGSGKSVCIAAIACALILNNTPDKVKLVMLDPKMVELSRFNGLPHLLGPVETDTDRIIGVLKWCTREMDRRYKLLEEHAVRNIDSYNSKFGTRRRGRDYLPYIVVLVDEIGDLMLSRPEETETAITRLAQMARAVGIHLVVATQRPSVDVITGLIKANFPGRIAFSVASGVDSRVILDTTGAEALLGNGDMLYLAQDAAGPRRVQGCYVSDEEVRQIVQHWKAWHQEEIAAGRAEPMLTGPWERGLTRREFLSETDPMLEAAIEYVVETQEASASIIQRRLGLGYPRAARIMDMLEELGVVGESVGGGRARRVLIPRGDDPFKRIIEGRMKDVKMSSKPKRPVHEYYDEADLDGVDYEADEDDEN